MSPTMRMGVFPKRRPQKREDVEDPLRGVRAIDVDDPERDLPELRVPWDGSTWHGIMANAVPS